MWLMATSVPTPKRGYAFFSRERDLPWDAVVGPATWTVLTERPYIVRADDTFAVLAQRFWHHGGSLARSKPGCRTGQLAGWSKTYDAGVYP